MTSSRRRMRLVALSSLILLLLAGCAGAPLGTPRSEQDRRLDRCCSA